MRRLRTLPAVQQFSDQVRLVIVSPNGALGCFDAVVDGELTVTSSHTPFCDAARVLLDRGVDSNSWLILRRAGSEIDSLRAKVGIAARVTVKGSNFVPFDAAEKAAPRPTAGSPSARTEKSDPRDETEAEAA
jgi:hypothetical protein